MRTEIPVCTRCCFCIPLRYGMITWAYIKLVANLLIFLATISSFYTAVSRYSTSNMYYYKTQAITSGIFSTVIACEISFIIVMLIGGHRKNVRLLRITYMFFLTVWILTILGALVLLGIALYASSTTYMPLYMWIMMINGGTLVASILLDAYFLLILRSEIVKLANSCEFRFENHAIDAMCELRLAEKQNELTNDVTVVVQEEH